ncbi:MAG: prolipoprotein diacylglyceryl transferase [Desulfobacca sp.]|nr:prolipoprotein diacylglyceryl transferase [Desulfobacca sp.]
MYPLLLDWGPLQLPTYVVCMFLAVVVIAYLGGREIRRRGQPLGRWYDFCFYASLGAIAGAYLLFVGFHYRYYLAHPRRLFYLFQAGLISYGGLLGALGAALLYLRIKKLPWRLYLDALAVGLPLGHFLMRLGCFTAGCCFGKPTDLPWAVTYPSWHLTAGTAVHPAPLYEALLMLGVFAVIWYYRPRKAFDGQLLLIYLCLMDWTRFGVEFFRAPQDYRGPVWWSMPLTQWFALVLALLSMGLLAWGWCRARRRHHLANTAPPPLPRS